MGCILCSWNSSDKNTGVGCHSLLQGIFLTQGSNPGPLHCRQILYHLSHQGSPPSPLKVKVLIAQLYPTLCNLIDCSPPGSSVHGILQARILDWVAISFSRGSSQSGNQTQVSCIAGWFFTNPPQFNAWILIQADSDLHWSLWAWFGAVILALSTVYMVECFYI